MTALIVITEVPTFVNVSSIDKPLVAVGASNFQWDVVIDYRTIRSGTAPSLSTAEWEARYALALWKEQRDHPEKITKIEVEL